jgi:hypothetical protein
VAEARSKFLQDLMSDQIGRHNIPWTWMKNDPLSVENALYRTFVNDPSIDAKCRENFPDVTSMLQFAWIRRCKPRTILYTSNVPFIPDI